MITKKEWLLLIAVGSAYLYFYGTEKLPFKEYLDKLPLIGSGIYALGFMSNLAK